MKLIKLNKTKNSKTQKFNGSNIDEKNLEEENVKPQITDVGNEINIRHEILNIESHRIDYRTLNILLKIGGFLIILTLFFNLLFTLGSTIYAPIITMLKNLTPFIIGVVLAWLLNPIVTRAEKSEFARRAKANRSATSAIITILIFLSVTFSVAFLAYTTLDQLTNFITGGHGISYFLDGNDFVAETNEYLKLKDEHNGAFKTATYLLSFTDILTSNGDYYQLSKTFTGNVDIANVISNIAGFVYTFLIASVVALYTLPTFAQLKHAFKNVIPKRFKSTGGDLIDEMAIAFTNYMRGALKIAVIVGTVIAIGLFIIVLLSSFVIPVESGVFKISTPSEFPKVIGLVVAFGVICAVTNLIPYLGPFIGGAIVVSLTVFTDGSDHYWVTWAAIVVVVVVQSLESLVLQPQVMGRETKLHPVIILLGLTLFGASFGIIGMLISTPILAVLKSTVQYFDKKYEIF